MYNPSPFRTDDRKKIAEFLQEFNFGTIFAGKGEEMWTSSVPMLADDSITKLSGHFAIANPIWQFLDGKNVSVVFQGPSHYISPLWYEESHAVPTWNYLMVVTKGKMKILESDEDKMRIVDELSDFHEKKLGQSWKADWGDPKYSAQLKAIVAFEISTDSVEMKRKLSQNHPKENTHKVAEQLLKIKDRDASYIGNLMKDL